jgi:hypothetical protein
MDPALALPARRISDLLSSGSPRAKSKRWAMTSQTRRRSGVGGARKPVMPAHRSARDQYTPRLYGLVYNMISNHEDTNDLCRTFFQSLQGDSGGFAANRPLHLSPIAVNMTLNFQETRPAFQLSLDDVMQVFKMTGVYGIDCDEQSGTKADLSS